MNAIYISRDYRCLTALVGAEEVKEQLLFPSAASPVPSPVGSNLVHYWHWLVGEANHCEPFARGMEKSIHTPPRLLLFVQTGGGLVLPALPALLPRWEERGKRRRKVQGGGSTGSYYACSVEA